jgi:hypothetical protein
MRKFKEKNDKRYFIDTQYWGEQSVISKEEAEKLLDRISPKGIIELVGKKQGLRWNNINDYSLRVGAWLDPRDGEIITGTSQQNSTDIIDIIGIKIFSISPSWWSEIPDYDILNGFEEINVNKKYADKIFNNLLKAGRLKNIEDVIETFVRKEDNKSYTLHYDSSILVEDWFDIVVEPVEGTSYDKVLDEIFDYYLYEEESFWNNEMEDDLDDLYQDVYYYDEDGERVYPY